MSSGENLTGLYDRAQEAAQTLRVQAAEILEKAQRLEALAKDTEAWYATTRGRAEARLLWSR